ncbi:MAG TPA: hypothetical protein VH088_21115, partial [Terriglobales bacterium]|nr:hypothetical protein [Terriglobales bacterium]
LFHLKTRLDNLIRIDIKTISVKKTLAEAVDFDPNVTHDTGAITESNPAICCRATDRSRHQLSRKEGQKL